jgi:hypothetical protein
MKKKIVFGVLFASITLSSCGGKVEQSSIKEEKIKIEENKPAEEKVKIEENKPAEEKVEVRTETKSVVITENCFCCSKPYPKGQGYFYYNEAGNWYVYEQKQDILGVATGQYSCSRKCARDC